MAFSGLTQLIEGIGELTQALGKKMAYTTGEHTDGDNDLDLRIQDKMREVAMAIAFVSEQLELNTIAIDAIAIDAIAGYELVTNTLSGLPRLVKNLGGLSCSSSDVVVSIIYPAKQKMTGTASLQYQMGLSLASIKLVAKELDLDS